jgi:hypothetical protein
METVVTVAVILAMIALGAFLIQLLNREHAERISAFHYSKLLPGIRGRSTTPPQQTDEAAGAPGGSTRRDHRDGGRGRTGPRSSQVRSGQA